VKICIRQAERTCLPAGRFARFDIFNIFTQPLLRRIKFALHSFLREISNEEYFNTNPIDIFYWFLSAQYNSNKNKSNKNCKCGKGNCIQAIDSIKYDLSIQEIDGLIYTRLEEKLTRDDIRL